MKIILTTFALALLVFGTGATCRKIEYQGVSYSHRSFLTSSTIGKLDVTVSSNGVANVTIENFANDQVSAIREATKLLQEANKLKTVTP